MTRIENVRVGEILRLARREITIEPAEEYVLIGVYSFGKGIFHREPKSGSELGDYRFFQVHPGDLVLSNIQAWEGAIALADDRDIGTIGTHRFLSYVPVEDSVDTNWARWFFLSEPGMRLIQQAAPGTAVRNRTLAVKRFEDLVIPLPPLDIQREQATYLDAVTGRAQKAAAALDEVDPNSIVGSLPVLVDKIVSGASPRRVAIADIADLVADTVHPGDSTGEANSFVGLQHIERHTGRRVGEDSLQGIKGRKFRFQPGDVVYGYLRPYLNKVWAADRHGLCSVDQYVLRPKPGVDAALLAHVLRGQEVLDRAIELTHNLQLPRLRSGLLTSLDVPVVPEVDAPAIVRRLDKARDRVLEIAENRRRQSETAAAITPAALNHVFGPD